MTTYAYKPIYYNRFFYQFKDIFVIYRLDFVYVAYQLDLKKLSEKGNISKNIGKLTTIKNVFPRFQIFSQFVWRDVTNNGQNTFWHYISESSPAFHETNVYKK